MTPQGGPHSAGPMTGFPPNQSPLAGPSPGGRGYGAYGGQGPSAIPTQTYGQVPPGSAGGYGRPDQISGGYGTPQSGGGYQPSSHGSSFPNYQP